MMQVNVANVNIDIHQGPIGVSFSGGADSSLLLYILMKYCTDPIHIFTCSTDIKNRSTVRSSSNVLSKIIDLTKNYNIYHHFHYIKDSPRIEDIFKQQILFIEKQMINYLYTAVTHNPPVEICKTFKDISTEGLERDPRIVRPFYDTNNPFYMPFRNINKKVIAQIYAELDILDSLFPLTRSCESTNIIQGHCGECWWCEERLWAFNTLGD